MKKIWGQIKSHWLEDFSVGYYSSIILFLAASLTINYYVGLENQIIDRDSGKFVRILWYFLLYGTAYYGTFFLLVIFKKREDLPTSLPFWILTLTGILLLSINSGFPIPLLLGQLKIDIKLYYWVYALTNNLIGFLVMSLPLIFLGTFTKINNKLFGLTSTGFEFTPYLNILLVILPIIILASFTNSFQDYYPTYRSNSVAEDLNWPSWLPMFIYEVVYGIDFFNTEFMFRGFMVIGLAHLLGKDSIMPMVSVYCFLHFGKPATEAASSILGGYVLGVIAFYSKNIWGGVIIHISIAWMMELMAYLQKIY
jgi:membrane protease YdiL (CAAX protease family)